MAIRPPLTHKPAAVAQPQPSQKVELPAEKGGASGYRPPSRIGKRAAVAWLEPEAVKQLNLFAIQHDRQVQEILVEAINMWFAANGLPRFD